MNILIQSSSNKFDNHGDKAMLMVAHDRLRELWPDAVFDVITSQPDQLAAYCPGANPVDVRYPPFWSRVNAMIQSKAPAWLDRWNSLFETEIRLHWPTRSRDAISEATMRANVVVHSGGGVLNDEFAPVAMQRLDLLQKAINAGKPTAMFSQGIGPISHAHLAAKGSKVLSSVNFIALRESVGSYPILLSMGVDPSRIVTTGDDAIALAYQRRTEKSGSDLGVNIRLARYASLSLKDGKLLGHLRSALLKAAESHNASIVPIPVSEDDCQSIRTLMKDNISFVNSACEESTLDKVLEGVNRCRVVVTGSYHAAVFALSQGISAICLANSKYYAQKFMGLAGQFGEGCQVLFLDQLQNADRLEAMIEMSWEGASELRSQLLDAARRQIDAGTATYKEVFDLVHEEMQKAADDKNA